MKKRERLKQYDKKYVNALLNYSIHRYNNENKDIPKNKIDVNPAWAIWSVCIIIIVGAIFL